MAGVGIRLTGDQSALKFLAQAVRRAAHPRGMFEDIGLSLVTSTQVRFERGVAPDGSPWPPSIRALSEGGKTLVDSARLVSSLTYEASDAGVEVGTNVIYAAIHQLGGTIKPVSAKALRFRIGKAWVTTDEVRIPARPFLGLDADDEEEIEAIAGDWLLGPEREAGSA